MTEVTDGTSACLIHEASGAVQRLSARTSPVTTSDGAIATPSIAGLVPVTDIMRRNVVCARSDLPLGDLLDLVIDQNLGCVPIVDAAGVPIGMVTKRDLVEQLASVVHEGVLSRLVTRSPRRSPEIAEDVMLPVVITVDEQVTVARAAAVMAEQAVHHLPIVGTSGAVVGLLSSLDIVRWLARNDGFLATDAD
jgi:CBS domain-containing protein